MRKMRLILKTSIPLIILTTPLLGLADSDHPITVTLETASTNSSLTESDPLAFNESIALTQSITPNVYYSLSTTAPQNDEIDNELALGTQTQFYNFLPFAELEIINEHTQSNDKFVLDYDVGTAYKLTPHIYPLVVFDGMGISGDNTMIYGVKYRFNPQYATAIEGIKSLNDTGSGIEFKLDYTFL